MKVRHPNLNEPNVLDVDESDVEQYLAAGWKPADETPAVDEGAPAPAAPPVVEPKPARAPRKPNTKPDAGDKE